MQQSTTVISTVKRKKKIRKWICLFVLLLLAFGAYWYFFLQTEPPAKPIIRYGTIDRGDIVKSITSTGTLQATKTVQVGSQVSGTIKELRADYNSHVSKGQIVAIIDPTFYEAAVKQAEANYEKALADLDNIKRDAARSEELFQKDLISKQDNDLAQTKVKTSAAGTKQLLAALDQVRVNRSYTIIRAPISGTVVSRNVDVGQTVAASLNAPVLFTIAEDLTKMELQASVDEADVGQVKKNQEVSYNVDAFPGQKFAGTVSMVRINPTTQQNVVTYTVIVSTENPELKLLPGMTATAIIVSDKREDVLRIPASAIRFKPPITNDTSSKNFAGKGVGRMKRNSGDESSAVVYKKKASANSHESVYEPVRFHTGISDGAYTEIILEGNTLSAGDSVAIGILLPPSKTSSAAPAPGATPFGGQAPRGSGAMRRGF